MKILEYDNVDPLGVLHLTMLALNFQFTPEHAAHIRHTDPRPFPFFTVNAVEDNIVLGQVGVFRLPMISTQGREDVGGVWAVSTHPNHAGHGVASSLLDEAHSRMREAGLRFSTLGTDRFRNAYRLYQRKGYIDMNVWATALAPWEIAHQPTRLHARTSEASGYEYVESIFQTLAGDYLGFAWRYAPFARLRDKVSLADIWILYENDSPVGFVFARKENLILHVDIQVLRKDIRAVEAVAAITSIIKAQYVQVKMSRSSDTASLKRAGFRVAQPNWDAFMVKPLVHEVTAQDARVLFGIGTDRFLISWLDTT
jgi:GNAT superfamily N-acetyltransferase